MILHVQYKDFNYDYVDADTLDKLLVNKTIRLFYRPSEERLVNVFRDPIRGIGGDYSGHDRRKFHMTKQGDYV
jgi:hypothetical protein